MSKMVLLSVYLDNGNQPREAEKNLGLVNTRGGTQLLQIKGKANTIYRLVDEQTGQVVKKQFLLLKGKKLQVVVNQTTVVEIDNFLPDARSPYEPDKNAPAYVVDTGIDDIQLGLKRPMQNAQTVNDASPGKHDWAGQGAQGGNGLYGKSLCFKGLGCLHSRHPDHL
jgi:hypothetical protein